MIINRENKHRLLLSDDFIKNHEGMVYLGETTDVNGVVNGNLTTDLQYIVERRKQDKTIRLNNGFERFDHIVDSVEIGDEAVKRGLMTAIEARINKS